MNDVEYEQLLDIFCEHKRSGKEPIDGDFTATVRIEEDRRRRRRRVIVSIASVLAAVVLLAGAVKVAEITRLLAEASVLRSELASIHKVIGLDQAINVDFATEQPNVARLFANVDPALVRSVAVTYDNGESWRTLYSRTLGDIGGVGPPEGAVELEDKQAFVAPATGEKTVTVRLRVEYIPEVITAFPEYADPNRTEHIGQYELTPNEITKLVGAGVKATQPEISMTMMPLFIQHWETIYSLGTSLRLEVDPSNGSIVQHFRLPAVGDYTNMSGSIPGATPRNPFVSLTGLSIIEVQFLWNGDGPVTLESKLVDDHGKTVGTTKIIEPSGNSQTIRIPASSLKGYWGVRSFDYSRVRRLELAVARKAKSHSAEGTMRFQRIELLGTDELGLPYALPSLPKTLIELPLEPDAWVTNQSSRSTQIELLSEESLLVCEVSLPYDEKRDETLPWVNIKTLLRQQDFSQLQAIEIELMWQSLAPVTLEPKLVTSEQGNTYGRQILIEPTRNFQKIIIYPHDLKFYWSLAGVRDDTKMDLSELKITSFGIARKAQDQAQQGTLYIKAIHLLGLEQQKE